jgi:hypothetical protein
MLNAPHVGSDLNHSPVDYLRLEQLLRPLHHESIEPFHVYLDETDEFYIVQPNECI